MGMESAPAPRLERAIVGDWEVFVGHDICPGPGDAYTYANLSYVDEIYVLDTFGNVVESAPNAQESTTDGEAGPLPMWKVLRLERTWGSRFNPSGFGLIIGRLLRARMQTAHGVRVCTGFDSKRSVC